MTGESSTSARPAAPSAAHLIEVSFKGNRREFFTWAFPDPPALRTPVIVDADRGEDLGVVNAVGALAATRKAGTTHGQAAPTPLRVALRAASADDTARGAQLRAEEELVRRRAIEKVRAQGLEMKVSDAEWQWDRKKLTVYFTAEKRVDFRQLVRQLEGLFGTRVQMWHIGVRDEARRLDGIGRCARQFCSASWLPELRPVKSSVAKDQRLSTLNPSQISGTCGRLMCCLRYEHEFYVKQRKRFPKEGRIVVTLAGEEKVVSNDIFRERVTLRGATGEVRVIPLALFSREVGAEGAAGDLTGDPAGDRAGDLAELGSGDLAEGEEEYGLDERAPEGASAAEPPRGAETRTYPSAPSDRRRPAADAAAPAPQQSQLPQLPQPPQPPQPRQAPPQSDEPNGGRRRRRRGRRGGRRGREGGAPPAPASGS